jgi:tetratricopeptide (TPR) repeat protein
MAESAQKQIRDGYAALGRVQANHSASAGEMSLAYGEMGKLFMAAQYPDPAEACFLDAQMLDTTDFRWPYYLGQLYRTKGEIDQSRAFFERTLQLRPDDVSTMVWLGNMYLASGLPEAAEPQFAKALSLEPRSLSARYGLGRAALARNDPKRAVTYLEEILKLDPTATGAHYPLAGLHGAWRCAKAGEHLRQRRNRDIVPADPLMDAVNELLESAQNYETLIRALDRQNMEPRPRISEKAGVDAGQPVAALRLAR